tara:strand:- start:907 stop:1470 length:564 start_codon:yes stop_codon:yes gene_type:complete
MKQYNLKTQPNLLDLFYSTQDSIAKTKHPLAENYSRKNLKLDEFSYFNVVVEDDIISAFSGLQTNRWGPKIGRVATRLWVHPNYRKKGGVPSDYNSSILMPNQIMWAETHGYDFVFWSRQYPYQRHFKRMIERSTRNCPYGYIHEPLPDIYNVCVDSKSDSCWQSVCVVKFKNWRLPFDDKHIKKRD